MSTAAPPAPRQVPEWEHEATAKHDAANSSTVAASGYVRPTYQSKLDAMLPPHKRYLGVQRRTFLIILAAVSISLLALIIGLSVGLSKRNKS